MSGFRCGCTDITSPWLHNSWASHMWYHVPDSNSTRAPAWAFVQLHLWISLANGAHCSQCLPSNGCGGAAIGKLSPEADYALKIGPTGKPPEAGPRTDDAMRVVLFKALGGALDLEMAMKNFCFKLPFILK